MVQRKKKEFEQRNAFKQITIKENYVNNSIEISMKMGCP